MLKKDIEALDSFLQGLACLACKTLRSQVALEADEVERGQTEMVGLIQVNALAMLCPSLDDPSEDGWVAIKGRQVERLVAIFILCIPELIDLTKVPSLVEEFIKLLRFAVAVIRDHVHERELKVTQVASASTLISHSQ